MNFEKIIGFYLRMLLLSIMVITLTIILAYFLAGILQKKFAHYFEEIVGVIKSVSETRNYSIRLKEDNFSRHAVYEVITVVREINQMLGQIEDKNKEIETINKGLAHRVYEKTKELEEVQRVALQNAHRAGMMEVSSSILHNVGNIFNSLNISIEKLSEICRNPKSKTIVKANEVLTEHMDNLVDFIQNDAKGMQLMKLYVMIGQLVEEEFSGLLNEVNGLKEKASLMKDVIFAQQTFARQVDFEEAIYLEQVVEDVLKLQQSSLDRHEVEIVKNFEEVALVKVHRSKLMHILLNVIKNAREAMDATNLVERVLTITITNEDGQFPIITVRDTGCGVDPTNLKQIFTYGFTTKKDGHGFGIHYCANAMKEMEGEMSLESDGVNKGSLVTLRFKGNTKMASKSSQ